MMSAQPDEQFTKLLECSLDDYTYNLKSFLGVCKP